MRDDDRGILPCALCTAVTDATRRDDPFLYNSKLLETAHFVVIPSLGPFVVGHVMAVSKFHCESLASMGADALREYDELANRLRSLSFLRESDLLEAEHGSTKCEKAGACVVHTHVHLLPGMGVFFDVFKEHLEPRPERCLLELAKPVPPYIFARAGCKQALFAARGLASQTIRRVLCDALDRDDTDWMQAPRLDWVKETVELWHKHRSEL